MVEKEASAPRLFGGSKSFCLLPYPDVKVKHFRALTAHSRNIYKSKPNLKAFFSQVDVSGSCK